MLNNLIKSKKTPRLMFDKNSKWNQNHEKKHCQKNYKNKLIQLQKIDE